MRHERSMIGNGTVSEIRPGYYSYRFYYYDIFDNKKRKSFSGTDVNELYMKADEFLTKIESGYTGIDTNSTIPGILKHRYKFDFASGYTREPGYYRNLNSLKKIENSSIGKIPIVDVTLRDIQKFLMTLVQYSNSVISKTFSQLKLAYGEAERAGIVEKNLMENRNIRCPRSAKDDSRVNAFTVEEQEIFLDGLKKHKVPFGRNDYSKQLLIELYTGMRMGEINALRPEDVDLKKGVIHVRGTISMGMDNRIYRSEHPKTSAGIREVPINKLVRPILEEAIREMKPNKDNTIFYDYRRKHVISTMQVCSFFRRLCEKTGLAYYGQHCLRHTFATRCIEAGIQPVVIKTWLGHTDIHITLDTYSNVFDGLNNKSMDCFENYLRKNAAFVDANIEE